MKNILSVLALCSLFATSAFAGVLKTSSKAPNEAFPKSDKEILELDQMSKTASKAFGADPVGKLLSYECEALDSTIKCVFSHDIPQGWDWYGTFEITYEVHGGAEGATSVSQKWSRN